MIGGKAEFRCKTKSSTNFQVEWGRNRVQENGSTVENDERLFDHQILKEVSQAVTESSFFCERYGTIFWKDFVLNYRLWMLGIHLVRLPSPSTTLLTSTVENITGIFIPSFLL